MKKKTSKKSVKKKEEPRKPAKKTTTKKTTIKKTKKTIKKKKVTKKVVKKPGFPPKKTAKEKKETKKVRPKTKEKKTAMKKVKPKIKAEKPTKKVVAKAEKKPKKVVKKVTAKTERKVHPEAIKKKEAKKVTKKPAEKVRAKTKIKEKPKKTTVTEKRKITPRKISQEDKVSKAKAVKKVEAEGRVEPKKIKIKKVFDKLEEMIQEVFKRHLKPVSVREAGEEEIPTPAQWKKLPAEYGENSITLITVDPNKIFIFWEVKEDVLKIFPGNLNVRVYDITNIDFEALLDVNNYFDIPVNERIGSLYIDVSPSREFIVDIGVFFEGIFIQLARSNKVSTPREEVFEEGMLPYKIHEINIRFGY